jgi:hypothetical protein
MVCQDGDYFVRWMPDRGRRDELSKSSAPGPVRPRPASCHLVALAPGSCGCASWRGGLGPLGVIVPLLIRWLGGETPSAVEGLVARWEGVSRLVGCFGARWVGVVGRRRCWMDGGGRDGRDGVPLCPFLTCVVAPFDSPRMPKLARQ